MVPSRLVITSRRLLPLATLLFLALGAIGAMGLPTVVAYPLVAGLAVVAGVAVTVGLRDLRRAVAAIPAPDPDAEPGSIARWRHRTFSALEDRNFRALYIGNMLQFGAQQMQQVVRGYLVFHLTGSFAALGTMALANAVPSLLVSPIGGVIADRATKKTVIQSAQAFNAMNATVIAILAAGWFGLELQFWHLFVGAFLQGTVNSMMQPSRQSMISDLVGRDRLMNAIGINSSGQTMMQLMGPGFAGFLISALSVSTVYAVMATMYLLAVTFTMRLPAHPLFAFTPEAGGAGAGRGGGGRRRGAAGLGDLFGGLAYVARDPTIRVVLAVNFLIVIVAMPYTQLIPGFVADVLHKGAFEQGVLQSTQGIGAVIGAVLVASAPSRGRGKMLMGCGALLGLGIVGFATSTNFWVTLPIMVFLGIGQAGRQAIGQVLIQTYSTEEYRGRVISVWFMQFGLVQFGTFIVGYLAQAVGPRLAIGGMAALLVVAMGLSTVFVRRMRDLE